MDSKEKARIAARLYYVENKERVLARARAYYAANTELMKARSSAYYAANKENAASTNAVYRASHREAILTGKAADYLENRDARLARCAAYKKEKPWVANSSKAKRRATQLLATPAWADLDAIKDVYIEAAYMQLHVDHIVPLQGKTVCGLHVSNNLQLLTASENSKKHNKFEEHYL